MRNSNVRRLELGQDISRGPLVKFSFNDREVEAYVGESIAAALIALENVAMRTTSLGETRGVYCGMGICFDCLVIVDGVPNTRACMTWVKEGIVVSTQDGKKLFAEPQ